MPNNPRVRFMANNYAALGVNSFNFSSEVVGFEAANTLNSFRSSIWRTSGHFLIESTNNTIYINDGSDKSTTITAQAYTTPTALASALQTALNAISANWTVAYDIAGGSYAFTISNSGSVTLRLSQSTNAIWDTIGFTSTTDTTDVTFPADEQRNHTNEFITFDFGWITPFTFIGIVSDVAQSFGLSSTATVTLEGNNIDDFTSPPASYTLEVTDQGIFKFNIEDPEVSHRFWRLNFVDKYNAIQGPYLEFGNIYLGDFQTLESRNVEAGFEDILIDPSRRSESEGGVIYFDRRTKYTKLSNLNIRYLLDTDKQIVKDVFRTVGTTEPFYISIDPELMINSDITEFTKFVIFDSEPAFTSIGAGFFNTVLNVREVV